MIESIISACVFIVKATLVILGALAAVHFAFKRFKNEALWSKKLDAYTKILEALHFSELEAEDRYDMAGRDRTEESPPKFTAAYKAHLDEREKNSFKAKDEMRKILGTGTLIISKEARDFLVAATKPRYDEWISSDELEFWDTERTNIKNAIAGLNEIARKDLELDLPKT